MHEPIVDEQQWRQDLWRADLHRLVAAAPPAEPRPSPLAPATGVSEADLVVLVEETIADARHFLDTIRGGQLSSATIAYLFAHQLGIRDGQLNQCERAQQRREE